MAQEFLFRDVQITSSEINLYTLHVLKRQNYIINSLCSKS